MMYAGVMHPKDKPIQARTTRAEMTCSTVFKVTRAFCLGSRLLSCVETLNGCLPECESGS